jgi:two-component system response regulator HydG
MLRRPCSAAAAFLPFRNSNDATERLARDEILPAAGNVPVYVGFMASDPTKLLETRMKALRDCGARGVMNYPCVSLLDGSLRSIYEEQGCTVEAEIAMLAEARRLGLEAIGFVGAEPDDAEKFAAARLDRLILTPGPTRLLDDNHERRDRLQHAIRQLNATLGRVREIAPTLPCAVFGGPITRAEDLEQVYRQTSFDGFLGGSVFGRYPIEGAVAAAIGRFSAVSRGDVGDGQDGLGPILGATPPMRSLFRLIQRTAACDLNVCIEGESGVGKELVATHIHRLSARAAGALVTVNCGAIPDTLLESELFGHERGAFTGSESRRLGKFEIAHRGTLFLDEVGDLSPRGQVALLRAIQQREITRVGGNASTPVDVRVLSATNRPLAGLVAAGEFRADLYYRLNNLTLNVPPLRDRADDIPLLVAPLLSTLRHQMNRPQLDLSPAFAEKLRLHHWPGNLRELQHVLAQSALLEDGPVLSGNHFHPTSEGEGPSLHSLSTALAVDARNDRKERVFQALRASGGNKSRAAARLGISRKTLYAWMNEA